MRIWSNRWPIPRLKLLRVSHILQLYPTMLYNCSVCLYVYVCVSVVYVFLSHDRKRSWSETIVLLCLSVCVCVCVCVWVCNEILEHKVCKELWAEIPRPWVTFDAEQELVLHQGSYMHPRAGMAHPNFRGWAKIRWKCNLRFLSRKFVSWGSFGRWIRIWHQRSSYL